MLHGEPVDLGSGRVALGAELDPELAPVLGVDPAVSVIGWPAKPRLASSSTVGDERVTGAALKSTLNHFVLTSRAGGRMRRGHQYHGYQPDRRHHVDETARGRGRRPVSDVMREPQGSADGEPQQGDGGEPGERSQGPEPEARLSGRRARLRRQRGGRRAGGLGWRQRRAGAAGSGDRGHRCRPAL